MNNKIIVDSEFKDWRLDKFLTDKLPKTRSQIQKDIKAGLVLINNKQAKVHQFLRDQDEITILEKLAEDDAKPKTIKEKIKKIFNKKVFEPKILFKDKDYIILEKPAGMLMHATAKGESNTLVDWLVKKFPEIKNLEDPVELKKNLVSPYRPGIVHRLDRDVSGLVLIPRNLDSFEFFKRQFKNKTIKKDYLALVHGHLSQSNGTIEFEISRSTEGKKMAAHPAGSGKGKKSLTEYDVIKEYINYSYVHAYPHTGRTNQIRVHFFALGHPIVGDKIYKSKLNSKVKCNRIFLHATKISFIDQFGKQQDFESPLPTELQNIINSLK